ncbi:hypothetical protein CL622_04165, partial [archaeon]|nr:hypothetical protein [archaeon]
MDFVVELGNVVDEGASLIVVGLGNIVDEGVSLVVVVDGVIDGVDTSSTNARVVDGVVNGMVDVDGVV